MRGTYSHQAPASRAAGHKLAVDWTSGRRDEKSEQAAVVGGPLSAVVRLGGLKLLKISRQPVDGCYMSRNLSSISNEQVAARNEVPVTHILRDLEAGNDDSAIERIKSLGAGKELRAAPRLLKLMEQTHDHVVRGTVAVALSEMGYEPVVDAIAKLLREPRTGGARDTLLFALSPFDCTRHLEVLVEVAIGETFEARLMATQLLSDLPGPAMRHALFAAVRRVAGALSRARTIDELAELETLTTILTRLSLSARR